MCGFVGVVRDPGRGPVTREELASLLPWLRHRGPDGEGVVLGRGAGLAATRLAIQGDRRSDQPLVTADGRYALAFNGELFATQQARLRERLARTGVAPPPSEAGDTALLAAALAGPAYPAPLAFPGREAWSALEGALGALALVDLEAGRAWVGRDGLGVKPLYLLRTPAGDEAWFASELAPLLIVARRLHLDVAPTPAGLAELWRWQRPASAWSGTPFPLLSGLLPGTEGVRPGHGERAWHAGGAVPVSTGRADGAHAAAARDAFAAAFARSAADAAASTGPVALFLSGGLDSAAVAAFAGRRDMLALTGRFEPHGGALDESAGAAAVAQALGLRHEVLNLSDGDLVGDLEQVIRALELPLAGPGSLALWRLARRARQHGRVVLTGTGGDELLGGYARTALALGRGGAWTRGYEALAERMRAAAGVPERVALALDRRSDLAGLFDPGFRERLEAQPLEPPPAPRATALDSALHPELLGTLPALLQVEDRVLMAHGLEGRPVFCLGDVPKTALALAPDDVVGPDGEGKRVLRALLRGRIPESVRTERAKRGFPTPFARAVRGAGRARAQQLLADRRFAERGWWDVRACRALLDEERPLHDRALFAVLSWELWARLFVDGDALTSPPPPPPPAPPGAPA